MTPALRLLIAAVLVLPAAGTATLDTRVDSLRIARAEDEPTPTSSRHDRPRDSARGLFGVPERESLSVVDAFAWEGERGWGDGRAIRVFLSDRPLDRAALDRAIDFELELERQLDGGPFAELEVDPETAAWLGSTFSLPDGWGCGWCGTGDEERAKAHLKIEGRHLRGRINVAANRAEDGPGVERLPGDGGEPARALQLCRASVLAGHREGLRALCLPSDDPQLARAAHVVEEVWLDVALDGRDALRAATLSIVGGSVKGDRALLRVETRGAEGRQRGLVFLLRTAAGWRYQAERLTPVWED